SADLLAVAAGKAHVEARGQLHLARAQHAPAARKLRHEHLDLDLDGLGLALAGIEPRVLERPGRAVERELRRVARRLVAEMLGIRMGDGRSAAAPRREQPVASGEPGLAVLRDVAPEHRLA